MQIPLSNLPSSRERTDTADRSPSPLTEAGRRWVDEFVMRPHEGTNRDGAVCPFVESAMKAQTFLLEEWEVDPDTDAEGLVEVARRMADAFEATDWEGRNRFLHTLVLVLSGLPEERYRLLDEAHRLVKPELVDRGLMLAQFHPHCDERAARNPDFQVARAPVPMLAMRRMALHDVLFLDSDPEWFAAYEQRYGKRHEQGAVADPLFAETFAAARDRWNEA
ncbi:hypothetical protein MMF93_23545 [Streptomyces tubbatahanensis]|uniref:DUF6875 domain-containing protein n=1 Tax=Streptomyces tubbatahanensis TaxID=2923272 RepID=A0ABY3XXI8_9ACTN|nr:hypothetical protein [Streptomyces tubbatahanensis]UNS99100.1 hypothetical protein MMF93_23545 [Streptomyces tubbatahanensis]